MHVCLKIKPEGYRACRKCRSPKGGQPKKIIVIKENGVDYFIGTKHKLYNLRYSIISRCYNAEPEEFSAYQGKGIKVCDEWINNPLSFYTWCIKAGWKIGLSIDRIDPTKNYCPENCQFITLAENSKKAYRDNQRFGELCPRAKLNNNHVRQIKKMLADGNLIKDIAKLFKLSISTISRINRKKLWSHILINEE
jgi:uncharacterized protein YerC